MQLYFKELVKQLDKQDVDWRKYTILMLDGAKYHQSVSTLGILRQLRIPMMITGPHSYNVAPIELLFAAIKAKHLNPD